MRQSVTIIQESMELPVDNTSKEEAYWDERFENEDSYDWFVGYEKIKDLMDVTFREKKIAQMKILILGEKHVHVLTNSCYQLPCRRREV